MAGNRFMLPAAIHQFPALSQKVEDYFRAGCPLRSSNFSARFVPVRSIEPLDIIGNKVRIERFSSLSDVFRDAEAFTTSQFCMSIKDTLKKVLLEKY